jgi:hypothetical protein
VGSFQTTIRPIVAKKMSAIDKGWDGPRLVIDKRRAGRTRSVAKDFTERRTPRCDSHSRNIGPNQGESLIQRCQRGEDLLKQYPERSMKGVVGRRGRNAPRRPRARLQSPPARKS